MPSMEMSAAAEAIAACVCVGATRPPPHPTSADNALAAVLLLCDVHAFGAADRVR